MIATAQADPMVAPERIDLKGVANFAALKGELLLAEREIFGGPAPGGFAKLRNLLIALLGRNGKAGLQKGLLLIALKSGLKAKKDWVRYGTPIAEAMGLSGVSALNHIIKRTEGPAKLPKEILSAMIEQGLEPIDGHNKRLIAKLAARDFRGTDEQARELVREEHGLVTEAKREARAKSAAKKGKKGNGAGAAASDHPARPLSEELRNCPVGERLAMIEAEVAALNNEMGTYVPGYRLQLVPVTDAASDKLTDEPRHASPELAECVRPVVAETRTDVVQDAVQDENVDFEEEDEDFPSYHRITEDQQTAPLKPGDRSALARRIIETRGGDIEAVLQDLPPNQQAQILHYCYQQITQSCCPAVRRGSLIDAGAKYMAPPLQARKGEPLHRVN